MRLNVNYQRIYLAGLTVIFFGLIIWVRLRLLDLPLERDEGEYAYMAQQLLKGILPYTETQSMKFPGIYFVYAGILTIFGEDHSAIHLALLFVNLATGFFIFLLGKNLFDLSAGFVAAICFLILTLSSTLQGIWANSEHFVLLPALAALFLLRIVQKDQQALIFLSGFLLGISLLIKQHAVFFCLFGALYFCFRIFSQESLFKKPIQSLALFVVGGIAPLLTLAILYTTTGNFSKFWFCTVQYASQYVSLISAQEGFDNFKYSFAQILKCNFTILWLSLVGLASVGWIKGKSREYLFLFGLFICLFLAISPGFYFRPHYFLLWMPALSLLAGAGFEALFCRFPFIQFQNIARVVILVMAFGVPFLIQKNVFFDLSTSQVTRLVYGLNPFSETLEVASYISNHSEKNDKVVVLGSEPQIYFYSHRKSATRHIYMYPLMEQHAYAREMQGELIREVENSRPKFVVVVNLSSSWVSSRSHITPMLKEWAEMFLNGAYEIEGVVDILSNDETIFNWGDQTKEYLPQSRYHLIIYKRRS